jgi:hypothetical protein
MGKICHFFFMYKLSFEFTFFKMNEDTITYVRKIC